MNLYKTLRMVVALAMASCVAVSSAQSGSWVPLSNQPTFNATTMFQLTDGRVLFNEVDASGFGTKRWWVLTPNVAGSYRKGTWSRVADSNDDRLYFGSGVFADGRVILSGGEYSSIGFEIVNTEIYNPVTNVWTSIAPPPGWNEVGDAPSVITADNKFFLGQINGNLTAFYNPTLGTWTAGPNKLNAVSSEETWTLLPDNTVISWDCFGHPHSQKYVPSINSWVTCGNTVPDLVLSNSFETGAGILLPNGTMFAMGGPPTSSIYTPPAIPTQPGTWTAGPVPPQVNGRFVGQEDAPGAILPNGNLLLSLGPVVPPGGGTFEGPAIFFEYDGTNLVRVTDPGSIGPPNFTGHLMVLPTGEVIYANGTNQVWVYTNLPAPNPAYKPTVLGYPTFVERFLTYGLKGLQFNGLSNGSSYGDEANNATNYPLVRLNDPFTRPIYYCRTFNHSTMGVQTGNNTVATSFIVPKGVPSGQMDLRVVANGVPSDPVPVYVVDTSEVLSFAVSQGTLVSGGLSELKASDNTYVYVNSTIYGVSQILCKGFVPTTFVGTLGCVFEGGVNVNGCIQIVEFWNWTTNAYETIDFRNASIFDLSIMVFASGNLSRFIDPSGEVVSRLTYFNLNGTPFQSRTDRFVWISGP